jgi:hypothetical protein
VNPTKDGPQGVGTKRRNKKGDTKNKKDEHEYFRKERQLKNI